eukprot:TRINITY_DN5481_c0_g1_i2.p1 TRINITY_DN5481_c0_g1~~TRINITY_DN5481_c0_g1_i2.p1  ORF type:complete len:171 (-),score=31.04 TRINITY_DN5481_c0_g1_i2:677-1189(-)
MDAWGHSAGAVSGTPCFMPSMMRMPPVPPLVCGTPASSTSPGEACTPTSVPCLSVPATDDFFSDDTLDDRLFGGLPEDLDIFIDPCDDLLFGSADYSSREILGDAISKALADPSMPLPLGLKPPSMEKVMAELQRQGIATVPLSSSSPSPVPSSLPNPPPPSSATTSTPP